MERQRPTPQEALPRTTQAEARLSEAMEKITNEDDFKRYLKLQAAFHKYSPNNLLLIFSQDPDATMLRGYRQWQELGRQVTRGAKAIDIFAPIWEKGVTKEQQKLVEPKGFIPVKVFDVRHTMGEPLPEPPKIPELHGEEGARYYAPMTLGALDQDFLVLEEDGYGHEESLMGIYDPQSRAIVVSRSAPDGRPRSATQKLKTLAHEFAHGLLDHQGTPNQEVYNAHEVEAEGSAFVALSHFGVDTSERSFPYIASYLQDAKKLRGVLGNIQRTARTIIESTESHLDLPHVHPVNEPLAVVATEPASVTWQPRGASAIHRYYSFGASAPLRISPVTQKRS